jgi:Protein of unknown function (DUF2905)
MSLSRWLTFIGLACLIAGLLWPWLAKLGLGRLPGDLLIERDGLRVYAPLTTGLIVSVALSFLLWLINR